MRRAWRSRRPGVKTQSATIAPRIRRVGDSHCLTSDGAKRYLSAAPRLSPIARRRDCDGAPQNGTKRAHGRRRCEESHMRRLGQQVVAVVTMFSLLFLMVHTTRAADPEIDRMIRGPIGKDWVTNGGNLTNQRYSTLKQIDTTNVKQLKGAWMTRLKGSGLGGKYSLEASPLVKDGIMYIVTGNDDVFALDAKTGAIMWEYWSGIDQKISTVCCGWVNRGLAMGEGLLFFGQLDANVVAIDMKTGKLVWKTPIEKWENGYGITSAPLYYDGTVYSGITAGESGVRGRLPARAAKAGATRWP